jgi:hypothetical protein
MIVDTEKLARAKRREAKRIELEAQAAENRRKSQIARRKLEKENETARRFVFGKVIDAAKATLTHEEKALLCGLVSRADLTDSERSLIPEFSIGLVKTAPSLKAAGAEFGRTGK